MIILADRVKGIGCRGARRVRSIWLSANWGRRVEIGAMLSWAGCRAQACRDCSGEICLHTCNVLYLSRVCISACDCLLSGYFHEDRNHGVCDALAVFLYGILHLC